MTNLYVPRTLIANRGEHDERVVSEVAIPSIRAPTIILGDPGSGKTELTKMLEREFGYVRVSAGSFYRNQNVTRFNLAPDSKLIIDGLDEITSSSGASAIDEVLKKLSQMGNPNFVLSCRSADWQGSTDRYKINEDYGKEPVTLHIQPFTYEDAKTLLDSYTPKVDSSYVLDELDRNDLSEFYVNPLTLTLIAEIVSAGEGLPKGRVELLDRATELLTSENNPAHQRSSGAQERLDALLDSGGAIFAHLLLSGSIGLSDRTREQIPDGYVPIAELTNIPDAPSVLRAVKTRLFQSPNENLYIPFHRVVAEYLGARWLSKRLSNGLSERRVFQALTFAGGVPTAFRGLHAWLAHFSPRVAPRCIRTDPFGVLRYGDTDRLPLDQARLLLSSLASLAEDDPYFRNEDWGRRAISGLARPELKDSLVEIIKNPNRHVHLSTLILEALRGSPITASIALDLLTVVQNSSTVYVERLQAAGALIESNVEVVWPQIVEAIRTRGEAGDRRLALEIIALSKGAGFSAEQIASAILDYKKRPRLPAGESEPDNDEDDNEPYVLGLTYAITQRISPKLSGEILNEIAANFRRANKPADWRPGYELSNSIKQLVERAIQDNETPSPENVWSWLKLTDYETGYSSERNHPIHDWLIRNTDLRRAIQRLAINLANDGDGPWIVIVHDLPTANRGLALSISDTIELLVEIGSKNDLSGRDVQLWADLVRSRQSFDGISKEIMPAVNLGVDRHSALKKKMEQITAPPKRNWRKEENDRQAVHKQRRARKFAEHRAGFLPLIEGISSGEQIGSLVNIANAYLGRYSDLDPEAQSDVRVREWLGESLANAALAGFVSALSRNDIPSAEQISQTHAEGKYRFIELVLICGIAELARLGRPLTSIPNEVARAALAAWWETPEADRLGEEVRNQLEDAVFSSEQAIEQFILSVIEPHIRGGQQHVPGLYRVLHEEQFKSVVGKISLRLLKAYPNTNSSNQMELLRAAIDSGMSKDIKTLAADRFSKLADLEITLERAWMSAAFVVDFEASRPAFSPFFRNDKNHLWILAEFVDRDQDEDRQSPPISIEQREFIVQTFGCMWPPAEHPSSSYGDKNPWDASAFIRGNIAAIGADGSENASASLERLSSAQGRHPYLDYIKHIRAQQLRLRRDTELRVPTFGQIKQTLSSGLPDSIDDLKAVVMDGLEVVQDYFRNSDTNAWEAFWNDDKPKPENTCRDRLLDLLRSKLSDQINLLPEITMPESNRADIVAVYRRYGVPIEIKGQWHADVWNAASVQLIEKYGRDWRADDRGIYLVMWFGKVPGKNLPKHPNSYSAPNSPEELRRMLTDRLTSAERSRIDVFILDVSKP